METKKKIIAVVLLLIFTGCALNQDMIAINERVEELEALNKAHEKELKQMYLRFKTGKLKDKNKKKDSRSLFASAKAGLDVVRGEIQSLSGQIDETNHFVRIRTDDLIISNQSQKEMIFKISKSMADSIKRIGYIEGYLNLEVSKKRVTKGSSDRKSRKNLNENQAYAQAKADFDGNNLEVSKDRFVDFLKKYPRSNNADNAQFWIGEIYYREKWYEKAILEYQKVIEKYPKGNKVPAAYLKQGFAFNKLGQKKNARLILEQLGKKYPRSNEAKLAKKKLKKI